MVSGSVRVPENSGNSEFNEGGARAKSVKAERKGGERDILKEKLAGLSE